MADAWGELLRGVADVGVPADLRDRIEQRRHAYGLARTRWGARMGAPFRWLLAGAGVAIVLLLLGLAAHSRDASKRSPSRDQVGPRRPAPVTDPSGLILATWLDPPQVEIKARPGDKVLEVQTLKHLTGPQEVAVEWEASVRALSNTSVRIVGVGLTDVPKEQVNSAARGAVSFTFHDRPKPIRQTLSSTEFRALATARAADIGLRLTRLSVIDTPLGPAVSIIATPTDGDVRSFAKKTQSPGALLRLPVIGTLVQVVDADNKVVLADGEAFITIGWVDPSLHLCQGLACQ